MKNAKYNPRKFRDTSFSVEPELQADVIEQMRIIESRAKSAFIWMFAVFVVSILVALLGWPLSILIAIPVFAVLLAFAVYHLIPRRRYVCPGCNNRMKIVWESVASEDRRFAVCHNCKRSVDTLWTSR